MELLIAVDGSTVFIIARIMQHAAVIDFIRRLTRSRTPRSTVSITRITKASPRTSLVVFIVISISISVHTITSFLKVIHMLSYDILDGSKGLYAVFSRLKKNANIKNFKCFTENSCGVEHFLMTIGQKQNDYSYSCICYFQRSAEFLKIAGICIG